MASSKQILSLINDLLDSIDIGNDDKHHKWSRSQLLISGFIGKINDHKNKLYLEIMSLICKYYPNIFIYGYGGNARGEFGIGDTRRFAKYELLNSMTNLCNFDDDIYGIAYLFMIVNRITNDIYCCGTNQHGQCFINDKSILYICTFSKLPYDQKIDLSNSIISKGMSSQHILLINKSFKFYGFGNNQWGQIGDDHDGIECNQYASKLRKIDMLNKNFSYNLRKNVIQIATGRQHSLILLNSGNVYGIGICNDGQLGIEPNQNQIDDGVINPVKIEGFSNIYKICCGHSHSLCLDKFSNLYVFGTNKCGQLGLGHNTTPINKPVLNTFFSNLSNNILIKCGWTHSMVIDRNRMNAFLFGNNENGEIGNGLNVDDVDDVKFVSIPYKIPNLDIIDGSLGMYKTALITKDNQLYITGYCNEDNITFKPQIISKQEIGIANNHHIVRVICCDQTVLVIVNQQ